MEHWWKDEADIQVLGVFQGGGAKGVAYAGALRAVARRGIWFSQVAGASAGAITAALVAAGVKPDELDGLTSEAMHRMKRRLVGLMLGRESLLNTGKLGDWLDEELRTRVRGDAENGSGVTFGELEEASGIACHVVALDLATGYPIVFSGALTPDALVVEAVLASSAIPGALAAGRAVVPTDEPGRHSSVHHLIDGGAWANYPSFVFRDPGFRRWAEPAVDRTHAGRSASSKEMLLHDTTQEPLIGLVLDSPPSAPTAVADLRPRRWRYYQEADLGTGRASESLLPFTVSMVLGPMAARLALITTALTLTVIGGGFISDALLDVYEFAFKNLDWWGGPLVGGIGALLVLLTVLMVIAGSLLVLLLGRAIAYSGVPAARALLGVATRVPPWAFEQPNALVLHLQSRGLSTLKFRPKEPQRKAVVDGADGDASEQIERAQALVVAWGADERRRAAPSPPQDAGQPTAGRTGAQAAARKPVDGRSITLLAVFLIVMGWCVSFVVLAVFLGVAFTGVFFGLTAIGYVVFVLKILARRAHERASGSPAVPVRTVALLAGVCAVLAAGAVAAARTAPERELMAARISAASVGKHARIYDWQESSGARKGRFMESQSLRIGEKVLLARSTGASWELATPGSGSLNRLFFPFGFGLAALVLFYYVADEVHYRRFRREVDAVVSA